MGIFIDFRAISFDFSMGAHAEINKKAKKSKVKSINVYAKSIKMCVIDVWCNQMKRAQIRSQSGRKRPR